MDLKRLIVQPLEMSISSPAQSLRQILLATDGTLRDVRIIPCKPSPDLFFAILVEENHWWEKIFFVRFKNHQIMWQAIVDSPPSAQSIYAARQISLAGFPEPLMEIFDMTHIGNGSYYLYRLQGRHARLLLETRAVDRSMDGAEQVGDSMECSLVYKNDTLTPSYVDINKDGYTDVRLIGTAQLYAQDEKTLLRQCQVQKIFLYNRKRQQFIEDTRQRRGFSKAHFD